MPSNMGHLQGHLCYSSHMLCMMLPLSHIDHCCYISDDLYNVSNVVLLECLAANEPVQG